MKIKELLLSIDKEKNIIVIMHNNPDPDTAGSGMALTRWLNLQGKKAYLLMPENILNKKIKDRLYEYPSMINIDELLIDDNNVYITVDVPVKKNIHSRLQDVSINIQIDHHKVNELFGENRFIKINPANGLLIYEIIKEDLEKDLLMVEYLLYAILGDTGLLTYSSINLDTVNIVNKLINMDLQAYLKVVKELKTIDGQYFNFIQKINLDYLSDKKVLISDISFRLYKEMQKAEFDIYSIINQFINSEGVDLSVTIVRREDDVKISFRSTDKSKTSALEIATFFGGGGHTNAAGATIPLNNNDGRGEGQLYDALYFLLNLRM